MPTVRDRLDEARLYLVCGDVSERFLRAALAGGVDIVQLRVKDAGDHELLCAAARLAPVCAQHGALFILNDRPELVAAAGADGVHLGQDDMSVARARELLGPGPLIGRSTHTPAQVNAAAANPDVDYTGVGPIHETPTKPGRPAVGLELIRYAARAARAPFFAIGGLDAQRAREAATAGASRIAVVRALTDAADPERAARALRAAIGAGLDSRVGVGPA